MKWMLTIAMMTSVMTTTAQGFENAHDAVHHMSIGWNLGNTLESCNYDNEGLIERTTDCSVRAYGTSLEQPQSRLGATLWQGFRGPKEMRYPSIPVFRGIFRDP